jgi:hypothetical protein
MHLTYHIAMKLAENIYSFEKNKVHLLEIIKY